MQFDIELNADHLTSVLEAVRREIATPKQMLDSLGESLLNVNRNRHNAGLAPDGTKWKPNAKSTYDAYAGSLSKSSYSKDGRLNAKGASKVAHKGPLRASGDMLDSFNYQIQGNDTLRLGFNGDWESKLAFWHHNGTEPYLIEPLKKRALSFGGITVKRVNHPGLPSRPLVGFPVSDQQLVTNVLEDHLTAVIKRAYT